MKKRKQSFLHLVTLLAFLALICAGVFWAIHQQSAPTADAQDGPTALELEDLTPLSVPLLPDEACSTAAQEMVEQLPDSPIIARVEATSSSMSHDGAMVQRFYVVDVYAGEGLQNGDLIWLTSSQWKLPESPTSGHLQTGYVNLPQNNWEYLVFLQGQRMSSSPSTNSLSTSSGTISPLPPFSAVPIGTQRWRKARETRFCTRKHAGMNFAPRPSRAWTPSWRPSTR